MTGKTFGGEDRPDPGLEKIILVLRPHRPRGNTQERETEHETLILHRASMDLSTFSRPSFLLFRLCEPLRLPVNFSAGTVHEQSDGAICVFADLCVLARNGSSR